MALSRFCPICGPKTSMCCMVFSVWGIIFLGILGIMFYTQSPLLFEDIHYEKKASDFSISEISDRYQSTAYNCCCCDFARCLLKEKNMKEEKIDIEKIIEILRLRINEENISTVCPLLVENLRQLQNVVGLDAEFASNFVGSDGLNLFLDLFKNICEMKSLLKDDCILLKRCFQSYVCKVVKSERVEDIFEDGCHLCIKLMTNCLIRSKQNCSWCTWIVDKVLSLPSSLIYLFSLFEADDDRIILLGRLNSEHNLHQLDQSNKKYLINFSSSMLSYQ
ncbi:Ribonuclease kappa [Trichinella pseudospiralis]